MLRSLAGVRRRVEQLLEDAQMPDDDPPPDPDTDPDAYMAWAVRRFSLETILEQVNAMERIRVVPPGTERRMAVDGKVAPIQVITRFPRNGRSG
jgi:hypothetical protein